MNNESNIRNLLLWLFTEFDVLDFIDLSASELGPTFSLPSGNGSTSKAKLSEAILFEVGSDATSMKPAHQQGFEKASSEEASSYPSTSSESTCSDQLRSKQLHSEQVGPQASLTRAAQPRFSAASRSGFLHEPNSQTAQSFNFGEIHAVQERFQALLKQRLLSEYENNPPLFPWESEVSEYPAEVADCASANAVAPLWNKHIGTLRVPGLLPNDLVNSLFERCQDIVRSPLKQGIRLVSAVENFFPDRTDLLEPIANMVLVPAYRSGKGTQDKVIQELAGELGGYEAAMPEQQVALSMLAAQEILSALTFDVSATKPTDARSWVTAVGMLELTVAYTDGELSIHTVLPIGGQVRLHSGDVEKSAVRSSAGALDLAWGTPDGSVAYVLEVSLQNEARPLNFVIECGA